MTTFEQQGARAPANDLSYSIMRLERTDPGGHGTGVAGQCHRRRDGHYGVGVSVSGRWVLLLSSVLQRDYVVLQSLILFFIIIISVVNLVVDIT